MYPESVFLTVTKEVSVDIGIKPVIPQWENWARAMVEVYIEKLRDGNQPSSESNSGLAKTDGHLKIFANLIYT